MHDSHDPQTINQYDANAFAYTTQHRASSSDSILKLIKKMFASGSTVLDLGCGSGRDSLWLHKEGYVVSACDGSLGMLSEARKYLHSLPIHVYHDLLPSLEKTPSNHIDNVLCSAVIMHLPTASIPTALQNIARILKPNGCAIISFRSSTIPTARESDGRLYTPISQDLITTSILQSQLDIIEQLNETDSYRDNILWDIFVIRKKV